MTMSGEKRSGWNLSNSYTELPDMFYTRQEAKPVRSPQAVVLNRELAEQLGLDAQALSSEENIAMLAGNRLPPGAEPLAQAYAGHQFGYFTMLGDGRALLLGEQTAPSGARFDIQLKGAGRTPYSRGGRPLSRAAAGGDPPPGGADREVAACRLCPWRHEHRQHDPQRRDNRLRALRFHGRL